MLSVSGPCKALSSGHYGFSIQTSPQCSLTLSPTSSQRCAMKAWSSRVEPSTSPTACTASDKTVSPPRRIQLWIVQSTVPDRCQIPQEKHRIEAKKGFKHDRHMHLRHKRGQFRAHCVSKEVWPLAYRLQRQGP